MMKRSTIFKNDRRSNLFLLYKTESKINTPAGSALLWLLTLGIFPAIGDADVNASFEIKDRTTNKTIKEYYYRIQDNYAMSWITIPFSLLLSPFNKNFSTGGAFDTTTYPQEFIFKQFEKDFSRDLENETFKDLILKSSKLLASRFSFLVEQKGDGDRSYLTSIQKYVEFVVKKQKFTVSSEKDIKAQEGEDIASMPFSKIVELGKSSNLDYICTIGSKTSFVYIVTKGSYSSGILPINFKCIDVKKEKTIIDYKFRIRGNRRRNIIFKASERLLHHMLQANLI